MTDPRSVTGPARSALLWACAVVGVLLLMAAMLLAVNLVNARRVEAEQLCRDRIAYHAAGLRDEQGSALADGLATTAIEGRREDTSPIAHHIRDLGHQLVEAAALRDRAAVVCAQDPDFQP